MTIYKILEALKAEAEDQIGWTQDSFQTIDMIRHLVDQIDHSAEVFPIDNYERLIRTLHSLKGEPLTIHELEFAREIVNFKFGDMQRHISPEPVSVVMPQSFNENNLKNERQ